MFAGRVALDQIAVLDALISEQMRALAIAA